MQLEQRSNAIISLGKFLAQFSSAEPSKQPGILKNDEFFEGMLQKIETSQHHNGWFTPENINFACKSWGEALSEANVKKWLARYTFKETAPKTVAVIMAGNIPLVGFHDFLSVLITGHHVLVKLSSNDTQLLPYLASYLMVIEPGFKDAITFTEKKLEGFDAVIATGSNNTARYFDYYFGKYPHIIRKNRNSVAVLTGEETPQQMEALANDIFRYFGLGCRNVSKIYVPKDFNFDLFFNGIYSWKHIINNAKYINNYDYNKAVYLMGLLDLLDNEFLLLKEDTGFSSPIAVIFYETYTDLEAVKNTLQEHKDAIQAVVSTAGIPGEIMFGAAQQPDLWEYADGVDTISFLLQL